MHRLLKELDAIRELSDYKINVGIFNNNISVSITDNESVLQSEMLFFLENGSVNFGIVATHPIERTWLTLKDEIVMAYEGCIDDILSNLRYEYRLTLLAQRIASVLKNYVTADIRNSIECYITRHGQKI